MNSRDKIAVAIYFVGFLVLIGSGTAYLSCSTVMPYHKEAMEMTWEELGIGLQTLLQALIKITAAGFFVTGLPGLILLLIPFRRGEKWAHWPILFIGVCLAVFFFLRHHHRLFENTCVNPMARVCFRNCHDNSSIYSISRFGQKSSEDWTRWQRT